MSHKCRFAFLSLLLAVICGSMLLHAQSNVKTAQLTFTTIDVPGALDTGVGGINNLGQVVGYYSQDGFATTGFLYDGGNFAFYNYPGAETTLPYGINDSGLISGTACTLTYALELGFVYDGANFTAIRASEKPRTIVQGINNSGAVVGSYGQSRKAAGFEQVAGHITNIEPPGTYSVVNVFGVNNFNELVGTAYAQSTHFGFALKNGTFRLVEFPGASSTTATAVNDNGIVVGFYSSTSCNYCGFALWNGKFVSFSYPASTETVAYGINNAGQIVGSYILSSGGLHGFVTNPITADDF